MSFIISCKNKKKTILSIKNLVKKLETWWKRHTKRFKRTNIIIFGKKEIDEA